MEKPLAFLRSTGICTPAQPPGRVVAPEILDNLDPADPGAVQARGDLRKLNWIMGHAGVLQRELAAILPSTGPATLMELGCGDGLLLLRALHGLPRPAPGSAVLLVDAKSVVSESTLRIYAEAGWEPRVLCQDVFETLENPDGAVLDCVIANLFLHHFETRALRKLLTAIATRSRTLVALEPRRSALPLLASRCLAVVGCNDVTRHDAPVSVRAGFAGPELSGLWPSALGWCLSETEMGLFSHRFVAIRAAP